MKLLVTGGFGFIGSHFVEMAMRVGHECFVLDNLTYAGRSANVDVNGKVWCSKGDICNVDDVDRMLSIFEPDAVVHFAAESHVGRSIDSREEFLTTNVIGTYTLLECVRRSKRSIRFLHVSTDEVYGSLGPHDPPWTEESPYCPNNPYSASKAASDHLVRSYHKTFSLDTVVTHASNNYGPKQHPEKLIPILIKSAMREEAMQLHGDGSNVRDWLHVDDHCDGLLLALSVGVSGHTYNFGGHCERSNLAIASLVRRVFGGTLPPSLVADRPGNDARYGSSVDKAKRELGWAPGAPIEERIERVVKWYVNNPNYEQQYGR